MSDGFAERLRKVEQLVQAVEATTDPAAQAVMRELLQAVLELHGRGFARILELCGGELSGVLARDELISSLLLLHDLHPIDFETRVRRAVASVESKLLLQGCSIALTSVQDGQVRIRLERRAHGQATSEAALRKLTEDAVWELAPDAESLEIDADITPARSAEPPGLVKLKVPSEAGSAA